MNVQHLDSIKHMMPAESVEADQAERSWLARDTIVNYLGAVVPGVVTLLVLPVLIRLAGTESFGFWLALLTLSRSVSAIDLGLSSAVTRSVASSRAGGERPADKEFVSTALWVVLGLGAAGGTVVVALALGIAAAWGAADHSSVLVTCLLVGLLTTLEHLLNYSHWVLFGARHFAASRLITGVVTVLQSLGSVAVLASGWGIAGLAAWLVVSTAAAAVITQLAVRRLVPSFRVDLRLLRWTSLRQQAGFSLGSQGLVITTSLAMETAPVMILGAVLGPAAIVVYHLAARLAGIVGQLFSAAGSVMYTASCEAADDRDRARSVVGIGTRWVAFIGLPPALILFALAPELTFAWLGREAPDVVRAFQLLLLARVLIGFGEPSLNALWVGHIAAVLRLTSALLLAQVALLWLLVTTSGSSGAALTVLLGSVASTTALLSIFGRKFRTAVPPIIRSALAGMPIPLALTGGGLLLATSMLELGSWAAVLPAGALAGLAFLVAFYFVGATPAERSLVASAVRRIGSWSGRHAPTR